MTAALFVIAPEVFRDEEYAEPKEALQRQGVQVTTASTEIGTCTGKLGMVAHAEIALRDVRAADYDAVVFIGGAGAQIFFDDPIAHDLAREAFAQQSVIGAICIAPSILARAGLLNGVEATCFSSQEADLRSHGARYSETAVVRDGSIVTANGPDAARSFGEAIADALKDVS